MVVLEDRFDKNKERFEIPFIMFNMDMICPCIFVCIVFVFFSNINRDCFLCFYGTF